MGSLWLKVIKYRFIYLVFKLEELNMITTSDRIRNRLVKNILRNDEKIHTLVKLFEAMEPSDEKMKKEIAETISEILYPHGIVRIGDVIHPNGVIS
jgi:hypothetical protein